MLYIPRGLPYYHRETWREMWVKIPVTGNNEKEINTALYYAVKMVNFYEKGNLKDKSSSSKQKAAKRELSKLTKQV